MALALTILFIVLTFIKIPIAFSIGISGLIYLLISGTPLVVAPQQMTRVLDSFPLLSVPLFLLAGGLMNSGGITVRIFDFANSIVGFVKGGLAHVNVIASIIFSGMTGTAISDVAGLGSIEIKAMRDAGYEPDYAAAVTAASATIGPIIPPSVPAVIFGVYAGVSIGKLFIGGIIPGLLLGLTLMVAIYFTVDKKNKNVKIKTEFSLKKIVKNFIIAFPALLTPVIIIGGIMGGIFSPTEAAIVAVIYAFIVSFFVYRDLKLSDILPLFIECIVVTGIVCMIIASATLFRWMLATQHVPMAVSNFLTNISTNKYVLLFIMNIILLGIGMILDVTTSLILFVPVFMPLVTTLGIDPIHFGVIMIFNLMIGLSTPPMGSVIYISAEIAKQPVGKVFKAMLPFFIALLAALFLITYIPQLVTWLPDMFMK